MKTLYAGNEILSDEQIIEKVLQGDTAIFELLIRRFNAILYRIGRMYGFNHHDTEDLMQDTHVSAYTQLAKFEKRSSYKTWISRIMINKCIYKLKYGYFKNETPADVIPDQEPITSETEHYMLNRELSSVIEKSLEKLPVMYRSVFVLREIEGLSVAETAALLDISNVNVKVRLNRAKNLLQKQLELIYSQNDIYSFNLIYCDAMVNRVFEEINKKPRIS
jgi:RNA polymerase sigma factor (sigma-70 family)